MEECGAPGDDFPCGGLPLTARLDAPYPVEEAILCALACCMKPDCALGLWLSLSQPSVCAGGPTIPGNFPGRGWAYNFPPQYTVDSSPYPSGALSPAWLAGASRRPGWLPEPSCFAGDTWPVETWPYPDAPDREFTEYARTTQHDRAWFYDHAFFSKDLLLLHLEIGAVMGPWESRYGQASILPVRKYGAALIENFEPQEIMHLADPYKLSGLVLETPVGKLVYGNRAAWAIGRAAAKAAGAGKVGWISLVEEQARPFHGVPVRFEFRYMMDMLHWAGRQGESRLALLLNSIVGDTWVYEGLCRAGLQRSKGAFLVTLRGPDVWLGSSVDNAIRLSHLALRRDSPPEFLGSLEAYLAQVDPGRLKKAILALVCLGPDGRPGMSPPEHLHAGAIEAFRYVLLRAGAFELPVISNVHWLELVLRSSEGCSITTATTGLKRLALGGVASALRAAVSGGSPEDALLRRFSSWFVRLRDPDDMNALAKALYYDEPDKKAHAAGVLISALREPRRGS